MNQEPSTSRQEDAEVGGEGEGTKKTEPLGPKIPGVVFARASDGPLPGRVGRAKNARRKKFSSDYPARLPIIRPKLPGKPASGSAVRLITSPPPLEPSSSNPRPLISLLDRTEFRNRNRLIPPPTAPKPKKQYFTEINEIRKEFGIPETFETSKPNTMSGVALSEKLELLQRLRGENKFLRESIEKKSELCDAKTSTIEQLQRSTADTLDHCQMLRETLMEVEAETTRLRLQMQ